MSECVRSVKVMVEVDTNKGTYRLDLDDLDVDEVESTIRVFIENLAP